MRVVSNSSAIIALARIGHLHILQKYANLLIVPESVYEEIVVKGIEEPGAKEVGQATWVKKEKSPQRKLSKKAQRYARSRRK